MNAGIGQEIRVIGQNPGVGRGQGKRPAEDCECLAQAIEFYEGDGQRIQGDKLIRTFSQDRLCLAYRRIETAQIDQERGALAEQVDLSGRPGKRAIDNREGTFGISLPEQALSGGDGVAMMSRLPDVDDHPYPLAGTLD